MSTLSARLRGLLTLVVAFGAFEAHAQDPLPEVMLLLDTSGSMQRALDPQLREGKFGGKPACYTDNDPPHLHTPPRFNPSEHSLSRLNALKDALVGSPVGAEASPCWQQPLTKRLHINDIDDPRYENHRADLIDYNMRRLCCYTAIGDICRTWGTCTKDHHGNFNRFTDPSPDQAASVLIKTEGLIDQFSSQMKFGLLAMDGDPNVGEDSFGDDHTVNDLSVTQAEAARSIVANGIRRPNVGALRHRIDINPGSLIPGNQGLLNDEFEHLDLAVGEGEVDVRRHNALVKTRLERIVGWGLTPTSALLYDLDQYYASTAPGGQFSDEYGECRSRTAILITGGLETNYYETLAADGSSISHHPYPDPATFADTMRERYPGLEIFVIGLNVDHGDGNQGVKIGGDNDHYEDVQSLDELRNALSRILTRVAAGANSSLASKIRPVVVTPELGDEFDDDVRQVRLVAYSVQNELGDTYGRIYGGVFGCPEQDPDNDEVQGGLEFLPAATIDYATKLRNLPVRTLLGRNPTSQSTLMATGVGQALFSPAGVLMGTPDFGENSVRDLLFTPEPEDIATRDPAQSAYRAMSGYFGSDGLFVSPAGAAGDRLIARQLGGFLDGEIIAVRPPSLGVRSPAYEAFRRAQRERPTLVVGGAQDGLIHFFRLDDGRELFSYVPRLVWDNFRNGLTQPASAHLDADGPLHTADVVVCRTLGEGREDCPGTIDDLEFRTMVAGALGNGGANVFGIDITDATESMLRDNDGNNFTPTNVKGWDVVNDPRMFATIRAFRDGTTEETQLGRAVSRPRLTHVRNQGDIRAAVIVGCGEAIALDEQNIADENGTGRCVLVLDATTGEVIRKFANTDAGEQRFNLDYPMVGSPAVFPQSGIQPAERAYIGDSVGRLWRMDLRAQDPAAWTMEVAWPPTDRADAEFYQLGGPVVGRPSIAKASDGNLVVVFGTGQTLIAPGTAVEGGEQTGSRSFVVSFSDELIVDDTDVRFESSTNWVLPLRESEFTSGEVAVRGGVAYFTTIARAIGDACASNQGRLYGVDFRRTQDRYATVDGRNINVVPALPILVTDRGQQVTDAISIVLPPGKVAAGLSIVTSPSCSDEEAPVTQVLLNVADSGSRAGAQQAGATRIERKTGEVVPGQLDRSLAQQDNSILAIELSGKDGEGNPLGGAGVPGPFPRQVLYWGSSFGY